MRKAIFTTILMFLSIANIYSEEYKTYRNPRFNFYIKYPASWKVQETRVGAILISPQSDSEASPFAETVDISIEDSSLYSVNMRDYRERGILGILDFTGIENMNILEEGWTKIGEKKAAFITYIGTLWGSPYKWKQYAILEGSKLYLFLYTSEEGDFYKFLPQAEGIIMSFRLIE